MKNKKTGLDLFFDKVKKNKNINKQFNGDILKVKETYNELLQKVILNEDYRYYGEACIINYATLEYTIFNQTTNEEYEGEIGYSKDEIEQSIFFNRLKKIKQLKTKMVKNDF